MYCTIIPDTPGTMSGLTNFFVRAKRYIHDRALTILPAALEQPTPRYKKFKLVFLSVGELGFENGAGYAEICGQAFAVGYALCPAWVAVQMRLRFKQSDFKDKRHSRKYVYVAMLPLLGRMGDPFIFSLLEVFGTELLYADFAQAHTRFLPDDVFVFWSP